MIAKLRGRLTTIQMSVPNKILLLITVQSVMFIVFSFLAYRNIASLGVELVVVILVVIAIALTTWSGIYLRATYIDTLERFAKISRRLESGDFSVASKELGEADGDSVYAQLNRSIDKAGRKVQKVAETITAAAEAYEHVYVSSEALDITVGSQTDTAALVKQSLEDMVYTIVTNAAINAQAAQSSQQSGEAARKGGEVVVKTIDKIQSISAVVERSAQMFEVLNKSCDEIGAMVTMISQIASKTNLLALNAAIEAARAGEQGRGFAVVADEVRSLASNTTVATKEISDIVTTIQKGVADTAIVMKEAHTEVSEGIILADEAGQALDEIVSETKSVLDMINEIASASDESAETVTDKTAYQLDRISTSTNDAETFVNEAAQKIVDLKLHLENWRVTVDELPLLVNEFKTS